MADEEELKFGAAMDELRDILDEIESEDVDLDDLTDRVERASELIHICRDKLEHTEMQVSNIIESLDEADEEVT